MEYCYVVPNSDELTHYGIKGMHWGIRRYQPYTSNPRKNGQTGVYKPTTVSGKKGKAEVWKARESDRQANRYNQKGKVIESYIKSKEAKLAKAKEKGASDKKLSRIEKKIDYGKTEKIINEKLKKAELNKIAKMSVDDVSKARLQKGAHYVGQVLKSTAVKAVTAAALAGATNAFFTAGKEATRVTEATRNARYAFREAQDYKNAAQTALGKAAEISNWNNAYRSGALTARNGKQGLLSIGGMDSSGWLDVFHKNATMAKLSEADNIRLIKIAQKAWAVKDTMNKIGFGLAATGVGAAATNFTRLGRINEYSTLSRKERKNIINSVRKRK